MKAALRMAEHLKAALGAQASPSPLRAAVGGSLLFHPTVPMTHESRGNVNKGDQRTRDMQNFEVQSHHDLSRWQGLWHLGMFVWMALDLGD